MRVSEISNRYAKALFELGKEASKTDKLLIELKEILSVLSTDESFQKFCASPLIKDSDKEAVLKTSLEKVDFTSEMKSFLCLLASRGRLPILEDVIHAYQNEMDVEGSVTRGRVSTASPLTAPEQGEISQLLSQITKTKVVLDFSTDPELMGGLRAQVGSLTIDDSIQSHLNRMREELNRSVH